MRAEEVARYLQDNPGFFEQHADLVANIVVPHPQFGEENDALGAKMHRLAVGMVAARSFQSVLHTLNLHLRDDFAVPHVAVRLWRHPEGREELPEFAEVGEELQAFTDTLVQPFCGSTSGFDTSSWFGEAATHVRSQGLIAMRDGGGGTLGMIALGSEDPERFYAGMGTVYLERLGEMAAAALARVLG